jgi:predicted transcriptional regulator
MELSEWLPDPKHQRLVEWLTTPPAERAPKTQAGIAEELGVAPRTIRGWMARDDVRRAWAKHAEQIVGDPGKVQEVLETLRRTALDPSHRQHTQAAKLYLEAVDAIKPPEKNTIVLREKDLSDFTDEELEKAIVERWSEVSA